MKQEPPSAAERTVRIRRRLERLIGIAATEGNSLIPLRNGDEIFAAMLRGIRSAQHTVDMMTFVYWRGDIARQFALALADRARAGARVRLLLDGFGSRLIETDQLEAMERAGVLVAWFRKPLYLSPFKQNHRCHRKVLVVDEEIAYTGGVGIAEEWCGNARNENEWRDTHVEVRGPAVDGIAAAFAQNWAECHDELFDERDRFVGHDAQGDAIVQVVRGSASVGWQDMQTLIRVMLESAEERFRLATAYFSPDPYFIGLLWVTDITQHRTREGWVYCAAVLDAFSRRIVGWSIDSRQDSTLVVNALDMAIHNRRPKPGGIIHADHGTQFTSWVLGERIRSASLLPSFGTVGDGLDNAMMESFWSSKQIELLNRKRWKTRVELANAIFEFIEIFYNRQRRHSALGYRTPVEYELLSKNDTIPAAG
ncbi:IS3 family transposase [Streptomyces sp. NBC_01465]|uniref:IS3 family transposase n=1 Tax=Streptomyces sp. NBC_01465 TaxID=2903878 RepID=UPI002E32E85E|nr:IS3 family transposase [Streptomyces sp. NBC_01465]